MASSVIKCRLDTAGTRLPFGAVDLVAWDEKGQEGERSCDNLSSRKPRRTAAKPPAARSGDWSRRLREKKVAEIFLFPPLQASIVF